MADDLAFVDATAQAELVSSGQVRPRELIEAAIERVTKLNGELNAVVTQLFEKARAAAEGPLPEGPLRGMPFLLKDLGALSEGDPYAEGVKAARTAGYRADHDSVVTERFRDAGLISVGRTNTPELGLVPTTEGEAYGPCRNPWDPGRSAGGSSGGSAAAVAAGMVPVAHASDGGGSIRIPASACGLVGLKPSRGRVPLWPEVAEGWGGMAVAGVVSRSVRDTAVMLDVAAGPCPGDLHTPPQPRRPYHQEVGTDPGRLRVGLLTSAPDPAVATHPECVAAAEGAARLLASLGHTVEPQYPPALADPDISQAFLPCYGTWTALHLDWWGQLLGRALTAADVEPATWAVAELGRTVSGTQFVASLYAMHQYSARVQRWWAEGWDVLVTPTIAEPPPLLGEYAAPPDNPLWPITRAVVEVAYAIPFNISGQPAMSLPLHWSADGLPVGVQLVAAYGREDLLLRLAAQLEQVRPLDRPPPPGPRLNHRSHTGGLHLGQYLSATTGSRHETEPVCWTGPLGDTWGMFGLLPRLVVAITWAVLAVVLFVTMFGEPLRLSRWLLDLSPFAHLPKLPAAAFTATPLAWLLATAVVLAAAGLAGFRRRDLASTA